MRDMSVDSDASKKEKGPEDRLPPGLGFVVAAVGVQTVP
jgi:hypothetical protein